jgi:hypothetical protein
MRAVVATATIAPSARTGRFLARRGPKMRLWPERAAKCADLWCGKKPSLSVARNC